MHRNIKDSFHQFANKTFHVEHKEVIQTIKECTWKIAVPSRMYQLLECHVCLQERNLSSFKVICPYSSLHAVCNHCSPNIENECPICRTPIPSHFLLSKEHKELQCELNRKISALPVECQSCLWQGSYTNIESHAKTCPQESKACSNAHLGCKFVGNTTQHDCPHTLVRCSFKDCHVIGERMHQKEHEAVCRKRLRHEGNLHTTSENIQNIKRLKLSVDTMQSEGTFDTQTLAKEHDLATLFPLILNTALQKPDYVVCQWNDCGQRFRSESDYEKHLTICKFVPTPCKYAQKDGSGCSYSSIRKEIAQHEETCAYGFIECPNQCGDHAIRKGKLYQHQKECPKRKEACPYCQEESFTREYLNKIHIHRCPMKVTLCQTCHTSFLFSEKEEHRKQCAPETVQFENVTLHLQTNVKTLGEVYRTHNSEESVYLRVKTAFLQKMCLEPSSESVSFQFILTGKQNVFEVESHYNSCCIFPYSFGCTASSLSTDGSFIPPIRVEIFILSNTGHVLSVLESKIEHLSDPSHDRPSIQQPKKYFYIKSYICSDKEDIAIPHHHTEGEADSFMNYTGEHCFIQVKHAPEKSF